MKKKWENFQKNFFSKYLKSQIKKNIRKDKNKKIHKNILLCKFFFLMKFINFSLVSIRLSLVRVIKNLQLFTRRYEICFPLVLRNIIECNKWKKKKKKAKRGTK